ncbi:hypothetical protein MXB_300 [Myxobolus squamalis]|nr:hypothetical protein MXB_300 [Myxobolus squamalis]
MAEIKELIENNVICTRQHSRPMTELLSAKQTFSVDNSGISVPTGEITMKGLYNDKKRTLEITVNDLKNVPALPLPPSVSLRIYILLTLLPNMSHKKSSEILINFPDCDVNQEFIFENFSYHSIFEKSLSVKIMNYEESPTRMIFAETEIFLLEFDLVQNEEITRSLTPSFSWKNGSLVSKTNHHFSIISKPNR